MLRVISPKEELFNDETQEFIETEDLVLVLEHSLISLSKWESEYNKPFLTSAKKSSEEILGYLKCMVVTPDFNLDALDTLSQPTIEKIQAYIDSPQSATTFGVMPERRGPGEIITSELIYYWMVAFNIPFECQHWHLNRLFALVRICTMKNQKPKKMSRHEVAQRNRELNAQRRAESGSSG